MKKVKIYLELWQSFLFYRIIDQHPSTIIKTIYKKKADLLKRFLVILLRVKRFLSKKFTKCIAEWKNICTFAMWLENHKV